MFDIPSERRPVDFNISFDEILEREEDLFLREFEGGNF